MAGVDLRATRAKLREAEAIVSWKRDGMVNGSGTSESKERREGKSVSSYSGPQNILVHLYLLSPSADDHADMTGTAATSGPTCFEGRLYTNHRGPHTKQTSRDLDPEFVIPMDLIRRLLSFRALDSDPEGLKTAVRQTRGTAFLFLNCESSYEHIRRLSMQMHDYLRFHLIGPSDSSPNLP